MSEVYVVLTVLELSDSNINMLFSDKQLRCNYCPTV